MIQLISLYAGYAGWRWISIPAIAAAAMAGWLIRIASHNWQHYLWGPPVELIDIPLAYAELCFYSVVLYLIGMGTRRVIEAIRSRRSRTHHQTSSVPHTPDTDRVSAP